MKGRVWRRGGGESGGSAVWYTAGKCDVSVGRLLGSGLRLLLVHFFTLPPKPRHTCPPTSLNPTHPQTHTRTYVCVMCHHHLQGSKVFLVAPPLPTNLAAFESWARSKRQGRTWLGRVLQGVAQVTLTAGDTLLLPPGESVPAVCWCVFRLLGHFTCGTGRRLGSRCWEALCSHE